MKHKLAWILVLSLAAGLSGCGKGDTTESTKVVVSEEITTEKKSTEEITMEAEVLTEEEAKVTLTYEAIKDNKTIEDKEIIYGSYWRPIVTVEGRDDVNKAIKQDLDSDVEAFYARGDELKRDMEACYKDGIDGDSVLYGYNEIWHAQKRVDDGIISFMREDTFGYTGNMQSDYIISGVNYDAKTGKRLVLGDISENKEEFLAAVKEYIEMLCETDYYKSRLMPEYEEELDGMLSEEVWYFDRGGITFVSNIYKMVVPYEHEGLSFTIPYNKLVGLKPEYEYKGALHQVANLGQMLWVDLDGDGKEDEIFVDSDYPGNKRTLIINGVDYSYIFELDYEQGFDFSGFANPSGYYAVLDIDSSDRTIELAIQDHGPSDDPVTAFLRYENESISFVGTIPNFASTYGIVGEGKGILETSQRMGVLASYDIDVSYEIKQGKLSMVEEELYPLSSADVITSTPNLWGLLCDVTVYEQMDTSGSKMILQQGTMVDIVATDNSEWVKIQDAQGVSYYIHIVNWGMVDSDGIEIMATDVFDNLWQAG